MTVGWWEEFQTLEIVWRRLTAGRVCRRDREIKIQTLWRRHHTRTKHRAGELLWQPLVGHGWRSGSSADLSEAKNCDWRRKKKFGNCCRNYFWGTHWNSIDLVLESILWAHLVQIWVLKNNNYGTFLWRRKFMCLHWYVDVWKEHRWLQSSTKQQNREPKTAIVDGR